MRIVGREKILERCVEAHGKKFIYHYIPDRVKDKIIAECSDHGVFEVRADHHFSGVDCRQCNPGNKLGVFSKGNANNHKKEWLKIKSLLYFLEIVSDEEIFYKVGVTVKGITKRVKEFPSKYKINVLHMHPNNLYDNTYLEEKVKETFKKVKYKPKVNFRGKEECFSENPLNYYYFY